MSIEHDITYKWQYGTATVSALRQLVADNAGILDVATVTATYAQPTTFSLVTAKAVSVVILCDQAVTLKAGGTNAVHVVSCSGTPTSGTSTATIGGQTTSAMPYNVTATALQAALVALSSVKAGGVVCTGGPLPGTPITLTYAGYLAVQTVSPPTFNSSGLGGGSTPTVSASSSVTGVAPDTTLSLLAGVPLVWSSEGYFAQPFAADVVTLRVTNLSGATSNLKVRTLSNA